jgi:uncharacterized protein YlxP (DUF503 family)
MVIGACTIELHIPGNGSLKGKRRIIKSLIARLRREFNISIAEVDCQDVWQTAVLGVVCVSNRSDYVHGLLTKVVSWLERHRLDVEVVDYQIEIF